MLDINEKLLALHEANQLLESDDDGYASKQAEKYINRYRTTKTLAGIGAAGGGLHGLATGMVAGAEFGGSAGASLVGGIGGALGGALGGGLTGLINGSIIDLILSFSSPCRKYVKNTMQNKSGEERSKALNSCKEKAKMKAISLLKPMIHSCKTPSCQERLERRIERIKRA